MLIVGAPIYAAGRIIIPNLLKDIIISNLPSGSKLSIGEISSDLNLTIIYSDVEFTDGGQNYTVYFPTVTIKPRVNINRPVIIEAAEALVTSENTTLKLNSVEMSIIFSDYEYKAPKVSVEIDKIDGNKVLAADNIVLLFAGFRGKKKTITVKATSAAINYNTPHGLAKLNFQDFFLDGISQQNIVLSFKSKKSLIDLSSINPFNQNRIIKTGKTSIILNLTKNIKWRAPFEIEFNELFSTKEEIVKKAELSGIWEWGDESNACGIDEILAANETCGIVKDLKGVNFILDDPSGVLEIKGEGVCVTPNSGCIQKIDAEIKTKNTAKIFSKVMTSGVINPLFGGVILGGLLSYPDNESKDFEHKIKFNMIGSKILINDKSIF